MITPAHHAELWRLLVEHAEATQEDHDATQALADTYLAGTCDLAVEARCDSASIRKSKAERSLAAFTRRVAAEPPPAPVGMEEIERMVRDYGAKAERVGSESCGDGDREIDEAEHACGTAINATLAVIRTALVARDERIAALEAGLREAADDLADHERWWRTVDEIAKADDARASIKAARALADAGKVGA